MIETMETTEWIDAVDGSSVLHTRVNESEELWKLHFYVSRASLQFGTVRSHVSRAILVDAVDDSNELKNRVNDSEELWKFTLYVSRTRLHFGTVRSHVSRAILDTLSSFDAGCFGAYRDTDVLGVLIEEKTQSLMGLLYFLCQSSVNAGNKTNVSEKMPTYHKLLWTDKVDAENTTSVNVMMQTYHKLLWTNKKHAGAAAATVIVLDSSYQHHDGTAAIESVLTYHRHSWTNDSGDTAVSWSKVFETIWWDLQFSKLPLFQLSGMVGWQNADPDKQKHKRTTKNTFFSPFSSSSTKP